MRFSEKLAALRRREGLSQEQLADRLSITRQSVSKWESGAVMPEVDKLIMLSDLFGVSVDYLVKDRLEAPENGTRADAPQLEARLDALSRQVQRSVGGICGYTSTRRLFGLPLLSVRIGHARQPNRDNTAVGIVAVGNFAVGVISVGLISVGTLSLGIITFGLLALGVVSIGALAVGVTAMGLASIGISSLGVRHAFGLAAETLRP